MEDYLELDETGTDHVVVRIVHSLLDEGAATLYWTEVLRRQSQGLSKLTYDGLVHALRHAFEPKNIKMKACMSIRNYQQEVVTL